MLRAQAQSVALCFALLEAHVGTVLVRDSLGLHVPTYQPGCSFSSAFRSVAARAVDCSSSTSDTTLEPGGDTAYLLLSLSGKALWSMLSAGGTLADVRSEADKILRWISAGTGSPAPAYTADATSTAATVDTDALWRFALSCLHSAHLHSPEPAAAADAALESHDAAMEFLAVHLTCPLTERPLSQGLRGDPSKGRKRRPEVPDNCPVMTTPLAGSKRERSGSASLVRPTAVHGSPLAIRAAGQSSSPRHVHDGTSATADSACCDAVGSPGILLCSPLSTSPQRRVANDAGADTAVGGVAGDGLDADVSADLPTALTGMVLSTPTMREDADMTVQTTSPFSTARSSVHDAATAASSSLNDSSLSRGFSPPRAPPATPSDKSPSSEHTHLRLLRVLDRNIAVLSDTLRCLGVEVVGGSFFDVAASPRPPSPSAFSLDEESLGRAVEGASSIPHSMNDPGGKRPRTLSAAPAEVAALEEASQLEARPSSTASRSARAAISPSPGLSADVPSSLASPPPFPPPPSTPRLDGSGGSTRGSSNLSLSGCGRSGSRVRWSESVQDAQDSKRRARLASFDEMTFGPQGERELLITPRDLERMAYKGDAKEPTPLLPAGPLPPSVGQSVSRVPGAWPLALPSLRCIPIQPPRYSALSTGFSHRMWQLSEARQHRDGDPLSAPSASPRAPEGNAGDATGPRPALSRSNSMDWTTLAARTPSPDGRVASLRALRAAVDGILSAYEDDGLRDAQVASLQRAYTAAVAERDAYQRMGLPLRDARQRQPED